MIKNATINGNPLSVWGAALMSGTVEVLLTPAPVKEYIKGESRLEHGSRIVMANVKTASREVSLPFLIEGGGREDFLHKYMSFVDELYKGIYQSWTKRSVWLTSRVENTGATAIAGQNW